MLEEWEDVLGTVEVVTGKGGIFDVHLDGELIFTKSMLGRYPEPEDILPLSATGSADAYGCCLHTEI